MKLDASNFEGCLARIAARGSIGQKEAFKLLEEVSEAGERMRRSGVSEPIVEAAWQLARDNLAGAERIKADAVLNAGKRIERLNEATVGDTISKAWNTLRGTLFWLSGNEDKQNVQAMWRDLSGRWNSAAWAKLYKAGLLDYVKNPEAFTDIAREVWKLRSGEAMIELPSGSAARQVAEIIFESQEAQRGRMNAVGARIFDAKDWIAQTSHDQSLLQRGGRGASPVKDVNEAWQRWRDTVKDKIDEGQTFADVVPKDGETMDQAKERFLHDVFNSLYTGVHMRTGVTEGPKFEGAGFNLAKKLSEGRTLFWKDADSWSSYMQQYGRFRNWLELMDRTTDSNARRTALMEFWGTNPMSNLNLVMRNIAEKYRDKDPAGVEKFMNQQRPIWSENIRTVMELLDGTADRVASRDAAMIGRTARAVSNMAYLGGVALTHASSLLTTVTSDAGFHGINRLAAIGNLLTSQFKSMKAEDRLELLAQAGAFGDALARKSVDHFAQQDGFMIPGAVSAAQTRYMQATGLPYIFDHTKAGWREMLMATYGRHLGGEFDAMPAHAQKMMQSYGIGPEEWKLLKTGQLLDANGHKYLTPEVPQSIDRAKVEKFLRDNGTISASASADKIAAAVDGMKTNLGDRIGMMLQDSADLSVVTPGVRERAIMRGTAASGSWQDELRQAMLQFHSWPLASLHQIVGRTFYEASTKGQAAYFAGIALGTTLIGGYIRSIVRDLASGVEPQVAPRNVGEAAKLSLYWMSQGGGLGILGDMMFGELNRAPTAGSAITGAAFGGGPVIGAGVSVAHLFTSWMQKIGTDKFDAKEAKKEFWADIAKPMLTHTPPANLIYLKGAMNYMVWWSLFNTMKPGWYDRTNQAMKRESGRTMLGYKPYTKPPGIFSQ